MNTTADYLFISIMAFCLISTVIFVIISIKMIAKELKNKPTITPLTTKEPKVNKKEKHFYPLQLQAYERIVLFLERLEPSSLVMRSKTNDMSAQQLHGAILKNIREEYEHNVAQQIYITDNAWNLVKQSKEETIKIMNLAASSVDSKATGNDLTRNIFEKMMVLPKSPSQIALDYLKAEIKQNI